MGTAVDALLDEQGRWVQWKVAEAARIANLGGAGRLPAASGS
jgi:hypothetical protein